MVAKTRTNLTSLERLERQLQAITPDRAQGDAWEKALKGWINAGGHPELIKAWMWGEWPGKLKAGLKGDKGVDLVAETRDKQLVAIQVKFRRDPNDPVTAPEVQKLVGSYRKHFTLFALASNAWSATRGVSEAVGDEDAMLILREQLLESSYDWTAKKSVKRTKFTPFPFQKVAAENVRKALEKGGRAQIVMACGTGKTVTMLLAAEALDAQRVLVLAPTLLLVKQLRDEWISKRRPDREWASLAVCSDIGDGVDASEIAPAEFGAPPTTNPDDIAAFLRKPGRRVVFGTYASSDRIAKAQKKTGVPAFDLAVADEAHRIAGVVAAKDTSERSQRVMLEEKEIKAVRRLFATATPRITGSKKTREGDDILIESMDDESRFGKVAHSVTFQEAVKLKRLVPYKLVVTIVTNDEVADAVQNRHFIDVNGQAYAADEVATAIAIRRAYKDLGISKIISYHSRVAGAKSFAELIAQVPGRGKPPVTEHVAGSMPVNDRRQVLNRLASTTEPYLVTNARCLTEGIDVPALDAVAFADPRKSQVDIVQAVGRAMRRPMGKSKKTTGYIILPVYLTNKELKDPETAVEGSAFEPVLQVLRALKDHDPFMARFMAKILVANGKKPHQKPGGIREILEVSIGSELDKVLAKRLFEAVHLKAIKVVASTFEIGIQLLIEFKALNGHLNVPVGHTIRDFNLGRWVSNVRSGIVSLSPDRTAQLEEIGFIWNALDWRWEKNFDLLRQYVNREGHCNVPQEWEESGIVLADWISRQRYGKNQLPAEKIQRLNSLGMSWDPRADLWAEGIHHLRAFVSRNGHARVPVSWREDGYRLGGWVSTVRSAGKNGLSSNKLRDLNEVGFEWDGREALFQSNLLLLRQFYKREGHTQVPARHVESGVRLGSWVSVLRLHKDEISPSKIKQLDGLHFSWDPIGDQFRTFLSALAVFAKREGHARVPQSWVENDLKLGAWISTLRQGKKKLSADEKAKLDELGFIWEPKEDSKESALSAFKQFVSREGHGRVPQAWIENGVSLGRWVSSVRLGKVNLTPAELKLLKALGFVYNARVDYRMRCLAAASQYRKRQGDLEVPIAWTEGDIPLGRWIQSLRQGKVNISPGEMAKLKKLGFRPSRKPGPRN